MFFLMFQGIVGEVFDFYVVIIDGVFVINLECYGFEIGEVEGKVSSVILFLGG